MFLFQRSLPAVRTRIHALRQLYRKVLAENTSDARGLRLMRRWLSPDQRTEFDASGTFEVVGCHSGKRYRIYCGTAQNVFEIDDAGELRLGLCFIPSGELVAGDVLLAQKIALETDENRALAVANRFLPRGILRRARRRRRF
jgi:hypothetical protein